MWPGQVVNEIYQLITSLVSLSQTVCVPLTEQGLITDHHCGTDRFEAEISQLATSTAAPSGTLIGGSKLVPNISLG